MAGIDEIREGDAVLFHTGWGQLWKVDNEAYGAKRAGGNRVSITSEHVPASSGVVSTPDRRRSSRA